MSSSIVTLTLLLLALVALLLNLNLCTPWSWRIKAAAVMVSFTVLAAAYHVVWQLLGWPVQVALPEDTKVLAIQVREPAKEGGDAGAIFLWGQAANDPASPPRAYQLPYSRALHESASQARRRLRDGRAQGARPGAAGRDTLEGRGAPVTFFDLDKPALPEKKR